MADPEREVRGLSFRDRVLGILQDVHDPARAAALIDAVRDSMELQRRREVGQELAAARWHAANIAMQDATHALMQDATQGAPQHAPHAANGYAPKRAESLPAAKQDAPHDAPRGTQTALPLGSPSGSVSDSDPDPISASGSGARDPSTTAHVAPPRAPKKPAPGFDAFWAVYPRKVGKAAARRIWERQAPPLERVLATLAWQTTGSDWTRDGGLYIPHPATWLNRGSWEDERPKNGAHGRFVVPAPGSEESERVYGPPGEVKL